MLQLTRRALAVAALFAPLAVMAQAGWPNKPIKVIVPFAAGSTTDIIARAITDKMGQSMGQTLVIENKGGASGTIGQAQVATAAPDGYTIMVHSSSHTVSPHTFAKLPFDTEKDFVGITPISSTPNVLVMSPTKNIKTLGELLTFARAVASRSLSDLMFFDGAITSTLGVEEIGVTPVKSFSVSNGSFANVDGLTVCDDEWIMIV